MTCQEFWEIMPELRREMNPGVPGTEHARSCPHCAALMAQHHSLAAALRRASAGWGDGGAPKHVEQRLTAAFRSHGGLSPASHQPLWVPLMTFTAAAAVMVVLAVFLMSDRQPEPPARRSPAAMYLARVDAFDRPAYDDGFLPLPHAVYLEAGEAMDLVRVEVPRSAMMALGISVSADRADERVQAEVKVGADGIARAVRFLNEEPAVNE